MPDRVSDFQSIFICMSGTHFSSPVEPQAQTWKCLPNKNKVFLDLDSRQRNFVEICLFYQTFRTVHYKAMYAVVVMAGSSLNWWEYSKAGCFTLFEHITCNLCGRLSCRLAGRIRRRYWLVLILAINWVHKILWHKLQRQNKTHSNLFYVFPCSKCLICNIKLAFSWVREFPWENKLKKLFNKQLPYNYVVRRWPPWIC